MKLLSKRHNKPVAIEVGGGEKEWIRDMFGINMVVMLC
jgi:hypothetical protein